MPYIPDLVFHSVIHSDYEYRGFVLCRRENEGSWVQHNCNRSVGEPHHILPPVIKCDVPTLLSYTVPYGLSIRILKALTNIYFEIFQNRY